ncbi:MAG: LysR family transcriptional regulator [Sporolactobacillus sp.]
MNLNQLKYFSVLAQTEHFTHASEMLFITQPTLTHAIKELEKELNVCLFDKEGRNIKLNNYGRVFLKYVNQALDQLEKGENQVSKLLSPESGAVNIGFLPSLAQKDIPRLLEQFNNDVSSDIRFNLSEGNTSELTEKLLSEKIDLSLSSHITDPRVVSFPIFEQELYLITPLCHPLAQKKEIDFTELKHDPFIIYKKESGIRPIVENILQKVGIAPRIAFELVNDDAICGFVSSNLGIAIVPKIYGIDQYKIVLHKVPQELYHRYIYLSCLSDRAMAPSVALFKKYVEHLSAAANAKGIASLLIS